MNFIKFIYWSWALFGIVWVLAALWAKPVAEKQSYASRFWYAFFLIIGFWILFQRSDRPFNAIWLAQTKTTTAIGFILVLLGLLLAFWARLTLGGNWSGNVTFKQNHELIRRGPYAFVRHPIYTALLLMFAGTAIALGNIGGLIGFPLIFISFWIKLEKEEKMMLKHFPDQYPDYQSKVKRLVPFLL